MFLHVRPTIDMIRDQEFGHSESPATIELSVRVSRSNGAKLQLNNKLSADSRRPDQYPSQCDLGKVEDATVVVVGERNQRAATIGYLGERFDSSPTSVAESEKCGKKPMIFKTSWSGYCSAEKSERHTTGVEIVVSTYFFP